MAKTYTLYLLVSSLFCLVSSEQRVFGSQEARSGLLRRFSNETALPHILATAEVYAFIFVDV